ncbi:hypothetical protein [Yersinia bercovieri]|uniref:hypothetical protein n=1 Tax=Yersinia bercovieri TaxID=634 RepID=UPI001643B83E|nr:hypothetical protein [Yersinia bercovieri]
MKWLTAKNSLLLAILVLCLSLTTLAVSQTEENQKPYQVRLQIGFYDLLSQRKEVYDARITAIQGGYISTITSPNDNRFIFKGKFIEQARKNRQLTFSYNPIFFYNPTSGKMIDGSLDYLTHNTIFMTPMVVEGQPLIVGQVGIMLGEKNK